MGRYPCLVQKVVGVSGDVAATPSGIGSMSIISSRIEESLVTQTLAPESAIEVAGVGHWGETPTTVMGCVWWEAVWCISGW